MASPTLYDKGRVGLTNGITAQLNVGGAGKIVFQNAANTVLATINLNNPAFGSPNSSTGIASLVTSPSLQGVVGTSGTIAKYRFRNNANEDVFGGVAGTFIFTVDATSNVVSAASHSFVNDDVVSVESAGTLPAGLTANTLYYVISAVAGVSFKLSTSLGGSEIDITNTGTGTHTVFNSNCSLKIPAIVVASDTLTITSFSFDPEL